MSGLYYQFKVLSARYRACLWGDWQTLLLLIAQAPFIGWLCTLVWGSIERDTPSLYFVMVLASVWFGCINACREIVKERHIVERERLFGLSLTAYVGSKFFTLALLGLLQTILLQLAIEWHLGLQGLFFFHTLSLWGASMAGIGLGLIVSSLTHTQERAVSAVPLLLIPQILFSEFMIPREYYTDIIEIFEKLMPVYWGYEIFSQSAAVETDWLQLTLSLLVIYAYALVLCCLAILALYPRREV